MVLANTSGAGQPLTPVRSGAVLDSRIMTVVDVVMTEGVESRYLPIEG